MILTLHPDTPQVRHLERIAEVLQRDGVIAYPTDTLFGLGCLASRKKAVDRVQQLKVRDPKKPMSMLCADMEMLSRYARHLDTPTFRLLKQLLPGPYTVLLPASREVPRYLQNKQVVGLRIPASPFCKALLTPAGRAHHHHQCGAAGPGHAQHGLGVGGRAGPRPGAHRGLRPARGHPQHHPGSVRGRAQAGAPGSWTLAPMTYGPARRPSGAGPRTRPR